MATITSQTEQQEIWNIVRNDPNSWVKNPAGFYIGPWLGGYQNSGANEPAGGWQWVTGEPFVFNAWMPSGQSGGPQPNNTSGIEDSLVFMGLGRPSPSWNDYPGSPSGNGWQSKVRAFVVEYPN